jgi:hypothetical protein
MIVDFGEKNESAIVVLVNQSRLGWIPFCVHSMSDSTYPSSGSETQVFNID